jgi:DNA-directed RNA polymerase specialized sigma24 family protein
MTQPQIRRRYRAALDAMPPDAREVFWMHRIQDASIAEIAASLNLETDRVETLLADAIVQIDRALLAPPGNDEPAS